MARLGQQGYGVRLLRPSLQDEPRLLLSPLRLPGLEQVDDLFMGRLQLHRSLAIAQCDADGAGSGDRFATKLITLIKVIVGAVDEQHRTLVEGVFAV
jgi:hypothetical protein